MNELLISAGHTIKQAHDLKTLTLKEVFNLIKTNTKLSTIPKDSAPFYLPSGTFTKNSNEPSSVDTYSGIICIDIDNVKENTYIKNLLVEEYKLNGLLAAVSSISNNVYLLFQTDNKDKDKHKYYYDIIYTDVLYFINKIDDIEQNIKVDYLPNINRARFFSYDKDIITIDESTIRPYKVSPNLKIWVDRQQREQQREQKEQKQKREKSNNTTLALHLAHTWSTTKHGTFNLKESGNRNQFIHDFSSAANNLGVPKDITIEYIQTNYYTDSETGEQYDITDKYNSLTSTVMRAINNGYSRTDQFGTYILHSDLSLSDRIEEAINKKMLYLSKIDEKKSLPLLNEIQLLSDVLEELNKNNNTN